MPTPLLDAPELVEGQDAPETTVNEIVRYLEAFATRCALKDRDLSTPAALTPADGDCYLIKATASGAWTGHDGEIAVWINTDWAFITVKDGFEIEIEDEALNLIRRSGSWVAPTATAAPAPVTVQTGTSYTADLADANTYIEFDNASAIAFTVPPNSSEAFPADTEISGQQTGAGTLSIVAGAGVTINSRGGLDTLAGQFGVFALKQTAVDVWTLTGDLA